jgi:ribosomal subunit interface protein
MASPVVVVHFKDVEIDEIVREAVQRRCDHLADEFHEATRFELTIEQNGMGFAVHGHATGKHTDVATHAKADTARTASDQVLEKIERQLRKLHDKRIFAQRREAQKHPPKRGGEAI